MNTTLSSKLPCPPSQSVWVDSDSPQLGTRNNNGIWRPIKRRCKLFICKSIQPQSLSNITDNIKCVIFDNTLHWMQWETTPTSMPFLCLYTSDRQKCPIFHRWCLEHGYTNISIANDQISRREYHTLMIASRAIDDDKILCSLPLTIPW